MFELVSLAAAAGRVMDGWLRLVFVVCGGGSRRALSRWTGVAADAVSWLVAM